MTALPKSAPLRVRKGVAAAVIPLILCASSALGQHGVVREYAAFAPRPDAVPLPALMDAPLTDTSITRGADAFYLTGTRLTNGVAAPSPEVTIWRSQDLKNWTEVRTLRFGTNAYLSPEIHFLKNAFFLALENSAGGTELVRFDKTDLRTSTFAHAVITRQGITPSLFLDTDGSFYWVMGVGRIARMKLNPMDGLAEDLRTIPVKVAGPPGLQAQQRVTGLRGACIARIGGKYHLFVSARLKRNGLGRTGLPEGVEDVLVAASDRPDGPYTDFYVAFPNAGQTTLFQDSGAQWRATWSGLGGRAVLSGKPAAFGIEIVQAVDARAPLGFAPREATSRIPFGMMLRPETRYIYENDVGFASPIPLDAVPGQQSPAPWIRDTFIMVGHDGQYYLTGTSGNMDGVSLWRSTDLSEFKFVKQVWTPGTDPEKWYNSAQGRLIWAPELHYMQGTYWLTFSLSQGTRGKNGLLKSTSGRPEGPYIPALPEHHGVDQNIDSSLFQDSDGSVYYVWQDGLIRKLNAEMAGFEGEERKLLPVDGQRVGYEGATLVKIGAWYVLTAAEWNGGSNRTDGTYDMMYSCSTNLWGPYHPRRVAVPHAGHGALFKDSAGRWQASMFGNDRTAPFRAMPGVIPINIQSSQTDLLIQPAPVAKRERK